MITFDATQVQRLSETLGGATKRVNSDLVIAVNTVARKTQPQMAKAIGSELLVPQKEIKPKIRITKLGRSGEQKIHSTVRLVRTGRLPLKLFKPSQNASGVSVRISRSQGKHTIKGAFMPTQQVQGPPKPGRKRKPKRQRMFGDNVFKRVSSSRLPIRKPRGPSPWGVFKKQNMTSEIVDKAQDALRHEVERRIRFRILKAEGKI